LNTSLKDGCVNALYINHSLNEIGLPNGSDVASKLTDADWQYDTLNRPTHGDGETASTEFYSTEQAYR